MSFQVLEVLDPGLETTVQSWPGRTGLTDLGYAYSGPMDSASFRVANNLLDNPVHAAGLEVPLPGMAFGILHDTQIAVTGPPRIQLLRNGEPAPTWETLDVKTGDRIRITSSDGPGYRAYVAMAGGIDVPQPYGSAATSLIAGIGGIEGRVLFRGDILSAFGKARTPIRRMPESLRPPISADWQIEIVEGPHGRGDYLTDQDWETLTTKTWRVDMNSDRVAIRLDPHRFQWARPHGGAAGPHPANNLDNPYPIGGLLASGDVLTILAADTNTSGAFAVIATVPAYARWKAGQMRPGRDTVRFRPVSFEEALELKKRMENTIDPERMRLH